MVACSVIVNRVVSTSCPAMTGRTYMVASLGLFGRWVYSSWAITMPFNPWRVPCEHGGALQHTLGMAAEDPDLLKIWARVKCWDIDPNKGHDFIVGDGRVHFLNKIRNVESLEWRLLDSRRIAIKTRR
jgi:hypothetical protein